jgi:hypothetical protein
MKSHFFQFSARLSQGKGARYSLGALKIAVWLSLALFGALTVSDSRGQGPTPPLKSLPSNPKKTQAPLSHVYVQFLLFQNHLDKAAIAHEKEGKDGSWLRDHFQEKLGFTNSEYAVVRATALRLESELKEIGNEAQVIVQANREARLSASNQPTVYTPDPRLQELTVQREELIQREVAKLNEELQPVAAAKLENFLKNDFLQNTTMLQAHSHPNPQKLLPPQAQKQSVQP